MMDRLMAGEWARRFGNSEHVEFHRYLLHLGLRGLGVLNYQDDHLSGQDWFLKQWASALTPSQAVTVFDVGANQGDFALAVAKAHPPTRILCFEPNPAALSLLKINTASIHAQIHDLALSNEPGQLMLYDYQSGLGSGHASLYPEVFDLFHQRKPQEIPVTVTTLDEFCSGNGIDSIDLLKIDTEGNELKVLQGASRMLREKRIRLIHFEFNEMNVCSRVFYSDFVNILPGYNLGRLLPEGILPLTTSDALESNFFHFQNLVAFPQS